MKNLILSLLLTATMGMAAIAQTSSGTPAPKYNNYYYQRASLFEELPVTSNDIIMLGNSITDGGEWQELFGNPNIKNRGISADIIKGVEERLGSIAKGEPAKVFLMIGINNVMRGMEVDTIKTQYASLVSQIKKQMPKTKLYVESILPIDIVYGKYKGLEGKDDTVRELNSWLKERAEAEGYVYVDLYSKLANEQGKLDKAYTNDGLHLMGKGYIVWRDALLPYINE